MSTFRILIAGLSLTFVVALTATVTAPILPGLGTPLLAIGLGILVRQFIPDFTTLNAGVQWSEKHILEAAIVLLGFGIQGAHLKAIGPTTLAIIVVSFAVLLLVALVLQKLFREKGKLFWLLGAGSAICGSAAIGATAPIVKAKQEETGISIGVINLLGIVGMILLPVVAGIFNWTELEMSLLLGGILQSMGHVVGAAYALDEQVGQMAVMIKMGRIAFLFPFLIAVYFIFKNEDRKKSLKFPVFILFFGLAALVSQSGWIPAGGLSFLSGAGNTLLIIAMAAIGLRIKFSELVRVSKRALVSGSMIFAVQILFFGLAILLFLNV